VSDALPQKLYFRIGEVAGIVGVEPHVLRYWEREFRSIRPTKSARGQRVYSRRDVENLLRVRELLYTHGFTIAGARKQLQKPTTADDTSSNKGELATAADGGGKPPESGPPSDKEPPHGEPGGDDGHALSLRGTLAALREEVAAFLDELGG
jgi:DNA-binding transcriptional MerR regulator